ncbi:hypothetical protein F2Q70_00018182 [Brassica cretica]|uniref:2-C-methyl-D-erythritol 4-phosphate cytidylyltransferase, chloroplastic n=1 Tax=Brassica cretica TaxID=69181 RepID=A0A8S9HQP6_BRACR|nr:hypothetical protein F2Q70_00018182 [Brassica cretica]
MAMLQTTLGFLNSPTFSFSSSYFCPNLSVKSTSLCLGFSCRPSGKFLLYAFVLFSDQTEYMWFLIVSNVVSVQRLDFSKRVSSRSYRRDARLQSVRCSSSSESDNTNAVVKEKSVSVILLAGGQGKRMKMTIPKQYIPLLGQPIALYSFFTFSRMSEVKEIVVVCDPFFRDIFEGFYEDSIDVDLKFALPGKERQDSVHSGLQEIDANAELVCIHDSARPLVIKPELLKRGFELVKREGLEVTDDVSIVEYLKHPVYVTQGSYTNIKHLPDCEYCFVSMRAEGLSILFQSGQFVYEYEDSIDVDLKFALPGKERQDSVHSGLQEIDANAELVCIHDSARPLVDTEDVEKVLKDGWTVGAAVLGVPAKATIKEVNADSLVVKTLDRKTLWEMQTPQVIKPELLKRGFELVKREGLEVTDDVSIVEYLKHPVYVTQGSYTNIKVTTPDDLLLAERILSMDS